MFVPITSEITIQKGTVLKEIATGRLFEVGKRVKEPTKGWGDDPWEIYDLTPEEHRKRNMAYHELTEKFLAEVED